jgi:menaquinone-dependent protoporphyrinogen IX oxidase
MAKGTLVVCYSRSGTTRRVAAHLVEALGADFELIEESSTRSGLAGYLRSAFEAVAKRLPAIRTRKDPRDYRLVVIGTPVWFGTMSSPVRSYVAAHAGELRRAAFFAVMGGRGGDDTVREMQLATGVLSAPTCVLTRRDVEGERYRGQCDGFLRALPAWTAVPLALAP